MHDQYDPPILQNPPAYTELYSELWRALGYPRERRPIIIGVDGSNGVGKTSLASWIAWQFGMEAIHLDLFLIQGKTPSDWRCDDLKKVIDARKNLNRSVLIEGVLLLEALNRISITPDYLIFVGAEHAERDNCGLANQLNEYFACKNPHSKAQFHLDWSPPEERV